MTRYLVVVAVIALAAGALFRAYAIYGIKYLNMAGMIALFLIGSVGAMAASQWQATRGRKEVEDALLSLGPGYYVTDWTQGDGPPDAPDYLVVGPAGVAVVTVSGMPNARGRRARRRVAAQRERAAARANWVQQQLDAHVNEDSGAVPVAPILVCVRQRVLAEDSAAGVTVVNPDALPGALAAATAAPERLNEAARVRLTRVLRRCGAGAGERDVAGPAGRG